MIPLSDVCHNDLSLFCHILRQGVSEDRAEDLIDRKKKNPQLTGVDVGGRWISLSIPSGVLFDQMVESGIPPQSVTDVEFLRGRVNGNQFERQPKHGERYKKECEKRGGQTTGRVYLSQLARFPGDPEAWVGGRGDVQKVLESRGWGGEGLVNVKAKESESEPAPAVDVADKIVVRETARELAGQTVSRREYLDKKEKVKARLKPRWKK